MAALTDALPAWQRQHDHTRAAVVGVLPGDGVGPEVVEVAIAVLQALAAATDRRFEVRTGGPLGAEAQRPGGKTGSRHSGSAGERSGIATAPATATHQTRWRDAAEARRRRSARRPAVASRIVPLIAASNRTDMIATLPSSPAG